MAPNRMGEGAAKEWAAAGKVLRHLFKRLLKIITSCSATKAS
jgi:hypothetical protein